MKGTDKHRYNDSPSPRFADAGTSNERLQYPRPTTDTRLPFGRCRQPTIRATGQAIELQFDVRQLDDGDFVEVFCDADAGWQRGRFTISSAGEAIVIFRDARLAFGAALRAGLRRLPRDRA